MIFTGRPVAILVALLAIPAGRCAAAPDPAHRSEGVASLSRPAVLELDDAAIALFAAAGIALAGHEDQEVADHAPDARSGFARGLGRFGEHFGNPIYSAPVLGVAYLAGRLGHHPGLSRSALRIAGGMASAAAVSGTLKFGVGRFRPGESPDDPSRFDAFSSHSSFPSGHTTIAFSLAAGIDRETDAGWVPFVVYPAAVISGWSRLRDHKHWASDVVAGAVIGVWTSGRFDRLVGGPESRISLRLGALPEPSGGPIALGATLRF